MAQTSYTQALAVGNNQAATAQASNKQRGFSLIELLIVVAIIVILMTMALPSFHRTQMGTNETAAMASLKAIREAEIQYESTYPSKGFADNLAALGTGGLTNGTMCAPSPEHACILDSTLTTGVKTGYRFVVQGGTPVNGVNTTFAAGAAPLAYNSTGARMFCITSEDSQIRTDANVGASTTPPTGNVCLSGQFSPM
jgi:type IV pilus assembly protein PilA